MRLSRRRFLTFGAAGTALLGMGGGLSWLSLGYVLGEGDVAIGLSVKELAVVRSLVEALFPEEDDLPSGLSLGVHQRIDEEVWAAPDGVQSDLKAAIQLLEHLPPVYGYSGRFTALVPDQRVELFLRYLNADRVVIARAAQGLKQLSHLFYYGAEGSWAGIRYDGPWVKKAVPPDSSIRYAELLAAGRRA